MNGLRPLFALPAFALFLLACDSVIPVPPVATVVEESDRLIIVDSDGKQWDVTHAFRAYGMIPREFQFGLGKDVIRPLIEPRMIRPGQNGYPAPDDERIVIGVSLNGDDRAYAIDDLNAHEVVNEVYGGQPVAVGW